MSSLKEILEKKLEGLSIKEASDSSESAIDKKIEQAVEAKIAAKIEKKAQQAPRVVIVSLDEDPDTGFFDGDIAVNEAVEQGLNLASVWDIYYDHQAVFDKRHEMDLLKNRNPREWFDRVVSKAINHSNPQINYQTGAEVYDLLNSKGWNGNEFLRAVAMNDRTYWESFLNEQANASQYEEQFADETIQPQASKKIVEKKAQVAMEEEIAVEPQKRVLKFEEPAGTFVTKPGVTYLSDDIIDRWYEDALAKRQVKDVGREISDRARALHDAGIITLG